MITVVINQSCSYAMKNDLSARMRQARGKEAQTDFAARIGIGQHTLSRYENGKTSPDAEVLQRFCELCGIEPAWLLFGRGPMRSGEADSQEQKVAQTPPADVSLNAHSYEGSNQLAVAHERLWQMMERERELQKETGELKAKIAILEERLGSLERSSRDMRGLYELQEEEIRSEQTSANIVPLRTPSNR